MKRISSVCALIKLKQNGLQGKAAENIDAKWLCLTRKKYKEKKIQEDIKIRETNVRAQWDLIINLSVCAGPGFVRISQSDP